MKKLTKYKLVEIIKKEKEKNDGCLVHDLTVKDDHSYLVNDYVVHNCTTSANGAIHYPMASLVKETFMESLKHDTPSKILADGGFKNYSDIIKGLALGSNAIMVGGILNKCIESAGDTYWKGIPIPKILANTMYSNGFTIHKKFRGMSTKEVQKKWGKKILKTSEGIVTKGRKVEYTLPGWTENFQDYLKSAMSYCDCRTMNEFVGNVDYNLITPAAFQRFNK